MSPRPRLEKTKERETKTDRERERRNNDEGKQKEEEDRYRYRILIPSTEHVPHARTTSSIRYGACVSSEKEDKKGRRGFG